MISPGNIGSLNGLTHPIKTHVNLALADAMVIKVEEANSSQRVINRGDGLLAILDRSVKETAEINGRDN